MAVSSIMMILVVLMRTMGEGGGMMIKMTWRSMVTISDSDRYAQEENQG